METKVVLDCSTLKNTTRETPSVNVHGAISKIYEPRKFGRNSSQGFTIKDDTGSIYAQVSDSPFTEKHIGCDIEIDGALWTSYKGKDGGTQWKLDATKATVRYQDPEQVARPSPTPKKTQDEFDLQMKETLERYLSISLEILSDEEFSKRLDTVVALGWRNEDVRTVAVALFIEANRNRGLVK